MTEKTEVLVNDDRSVEAAVVDSPQAKWAALVADELVPLPRRRLKASTILHQAGAAPGSSLVRDLNSPIDVGFLDDAEVDLADGNVFRVVEKCERHEAGARGAPAKLAFIVDDRWEVTINPKQTAETLRELLAIDLEDELLRDFESPNDQPIEDGDRLRFSDGPVFRTQRRSITVTVNNKPVRLPRRRATGEEIKKAAIAQGVAIEIGFVLYRVQPDGGLSPAIDDQQTVHVKEGTEFRCVAPDDNS